MTQPRSVTVSASGGQVAGSYHLCRVSSPGTLLIKSIVAELRGTTSQYVTFYLKRHGNGALVGIARFQASALTFFLWEGWAVLQDGDELQCDYGGPDLFWWVSGSVLEGTIDSTVAPITPSIRELYPAVAT